MPDTRSPSELRCLIPAIAAFFLLALMSNLLGWSGQSHEVASVRLAGGMLLGLLIRRKPSTVVLLAYLGGAFVAWVAASILAGRSPSLSFLFGFARIFELLVAFQLVKAWGLLDVQTPTLTDYLKLLVAALGIAPLFGLLIAGAGTQSSLHGLASIGCAWWTGNAVGMLITLPLMLAWDSKRPWRISDRHSTAYTVGLISVSLVITALALMFGDNAFVLISVPLLLAAFQLNRVGYSIAAFGSVLLVILHHRGFLADALGAPNASTSAPTFQSAMLYTLCAICPGRVISFTERVRNDLFQRTADLAHKITTITNNLPALIAYIDSDRKYQFVNNRYQEWFGIPTSNIIGMRQAQLLDASVSAEFSTALTSALSGLAQSFEGRISGRDVRVSYVPDAHSGDFRGVFVLATDISEQKQAQDALHEEKERSEVTLASIGDAVIACDLDMQITAFNTTAERMTGLNASDALGKHFDDIIHLVSLEDGTTVISPLATAIKSNSIVGLQSNAALRLPDGREIPVEDSAAPIRDRHGRVIGGVMAFHDVSESKAMALKMSHMAQHDALTTLPNRVLFKDRLKQVITNAPSGMSCAVMLLDIDHFKRINESLGRDAGDTLLKAVAARLSEALEGEATVSREGGDEFLILLPRLREQHDEARIAQRILHAIQQPFEIQSQRIQLTASAGIALFPKNSGTAEMLIKQADIALLHAKRSGRGRFGYYIQSMGADAEKRLLLESSLRAALDSNQFFLCYQPKVTWPGGEIVGMEALVRWRKPDGTVVPPGEFIPVAEECGLITLLDEWVINESIRQISRWTNASIPVKPVSINVSLARLGHQRLASTLKSALEKNGVSPHMVEIEFTESQTFSSAQAAISTIQALKDVGTRIAMDDFGTGYSSLGYLTRHSFDSLKIDQSFVAGLPNDKKCRAVVQAVIHVAHALECNLVAEGVETIEQAEAIAEMGCHTMQGFLYGRPVEWMDMSRLLSDGLFRPRAFIS